MSLRILLISLMAVPGLALAQAPVGSAVEAAAPAVQFYVLSFTDAPITEVAEAVVGGALSQDLSIDPAIDGTMSFSAEGTYTPDALLQEFGTAALDQDVALLRSRTGDLSLMPRANMAAALAVGSALVALTPPRAGSPAQKPAPALPAIIYGEARWWDGPVGGLLIFLTGAASGAGALFTSQRLLRTTRSSAPAMIRITRTVAVSDEAADRVGADDPDLIIPHFESCPRDGHDARL